MRIKSALQIAKLNGRRRLDPAMAQRPYKINDRRGLSFGGANRLYKSSVRSQTRAHVPHLDVDHHDAVGPTGRRVIMTMARWLEANNPAIEGAITEQANYAVSSWTPVYLGENQEWADKAIEWLIGWEHIMDVSGTFMDGESYREALIREVLIDGDLGILLVNGRNDFPQIQLIRSHRIGTPTGESGNNRIIDGVVVNAQLRPTAYILLDENGEEQRRIPASDFILARQVEHSDQKRGVSKLGSSVYLWEDTQESREFELLAQKACAAHTIIETNEEGEADEAATLLLDGEELLDETGQQSGLKMQRLDGGIYRYLTGGRDNKIETLKYDRPSANSQNFQVMAETHAFRGLDWDRQFSLDPSKLGGAAMRVVVDKMNRTVKRRQRFVKRIERRKNIWAIARAIQLGLIPANNSEEWWRNELWDFQTDSLLTADAKYQSDVDVQEYENKFKTMEDIHGLRGAAAKRKLRKYFQEEAWMIKTREEEFAALGVAIPAPPPMNAQEEDDEEEPQENEENEEDQQSESDSDNNEDSES